MTQGPVSREQVQLATKQIAQASVPTRRVPAKPLEEVVDAIRTDSVESAERYLDETKVPHGGE